MIEIQSADISLKISQRGLKKFKEKYSDVIFKAGTDSDGDFIRAEEYDKNGRLSKQTNYYDAVEFFKNYSL